MEIKNRGELCGSPLQGVHQLSTSYRSNSVETGRTRSCLRNVLGGIKPFFGLKCAEALPRGGASMVMVNHPKFLNFFLRGTLASCHLTSTIAFMTPCLTRCLEDCSWGGPANPVATGAYCYTAAYRAKGKTEFCSGKQPLGQLYRI